MNGMKNRILIGAICAIIMAACAAITLQTAQAAPASGCGAVTGAKPGVSTTQAISVDGVQRTYRLHLPTGYRSNRQYPLVIAFHEHGGSAAGFERETGFSALANAKGFIAVYPQGEIGPDGYTGWNTERAKDTKADDLGFATALIAHLRSAACVNAARIYAAGFSNGGGFVARLACSMGDSFAAVMIVSGDFYPQPSGCAITRPLPILEMHGTADRVHPYNGSAALGFPPIQTWMAEWAARDGCRAGPQITPIRRGVTRYRWNGCRSGVIVQHDRLAGVGHFWPNGTRRTDYFNATNAAWGFFTQIGAR